MGRSPLVFVCILFLPLVRLWEAFPALPMVFDYFGIFRNGLHSLVPLLCCPGVQVSGLLMGKFVALNQRVTHISSTFRSGGGYAGIEDFGRRSGDPTRPVVSVGFLGIRKDRGCS